MMKKIIMTLSLFSLMVSAASALEIDEKLTGRLLKVSNSKKTVLVNRGLEDGLVVGDHAKFFLTTGVIARGELVKASPTRSVWALYRIVDSDQVFPEKVISLKISSPLKTTDDPTRVLTPDATDMQVRLTRGDDSSLGVESEMVAERTDLSPDERDDMGTLSKTPLQKEVFDESGMSYERTLEVFGLLHFNNFSTSSDLGTNGTSTGQLANIDFSLGLEKYMKYDRRSFLSNLSVAIFLHNSSVQSNSVQGSQIQNSITEYGGMVNYHFNRPPLTFNTPVYFATFGLGVGKASDTVSTDTVAAQSEATVNGTANFLFLGVGAKYFTKEGFGGRAILDYYTRSESYQYEDGENYTKKVAGPRFMVGLAYRW
ncbi:MAG: hypothetical protein COW00_12305 [Bdellovibrio sp. CG12_big_fil_rev_8_21_14_0_65_39_13]|nr:MAG: hypothetical protein COW78_04360 [Bdellovibrio sp. CG22_combo_CG10-13_8_21_14_all_39_27]PIQ59051.1 MAG: hypothetical protein COW00_12305 [Bdellovibrio sp. CG12_big_fil_rev_8_21_14_0_65_39_13]PIR35118.1 MAG: hypothetical protein COV37_10240 [Bdellovibrio sp. CG11_big_fil_rev_8_21_14_0_20_39_38]